MEKFEMAILIVAIVVSLLALASSLFPRNADTGYWQCEEWLKADTGEYLTRSHLDNWLIYNILIYNRVNASVEIDVVSDYYVVLNVTEMVAGESGKMIGNFRQNTYSKSDCIMERFVR